jgi:hypothetical protein
MWQIILPKATVHYSEEGRQEIKFTWNVEDRIYRGKMPPGSLTNDRGVLFPDSEFFMEFSWYNNKKNRWHCVSITPTWPRARIYLDANGDIDIKENSGTDIDRLKVCDWDLVMP